MIKVNILSTEDLRGIKASDNKETLVDLKKVCPKVRFRIGAYVSLNGSHEDVVAASYAREGIAKRLNKAQGFLPKGYRILVVCAYRSPLLQQRIFENIKQELIQEYLTWTNKQIEKEMDNRVSPPDVGPHCCGGAIDITIIDSSGKQLNMGTKFSEFGEKTFTDSMLVSVDVKRNRALLKEVMEKAGFVNFPAEWWHWSYGDREWAYHQKNKIAIYDLITKE